MAAWFDDTDWSEIHADNNQKMESQQARQAPPIRDDREDLALRPLTIRVGDTAECEGSARWTQGNTSVAVSVYFLPAPHAGMDVFDRATLTVDITCPSIAITPGSSSSVQRKREKSLNLVVSRVLESAVDLTSFPNQSIYVKGLVLSEGGSLASVAINCAVLAALNTGIIMRCTPSAASLAIFSDGRLLLDPTSAEERVCDGSYLLVCGHKQEREVSDSDALKSFDPHVIYSCCEGFCKAETLSSANYTGKSAADMTINCMRGAIAAACRI
jgi:ribonuclease PH